MQGAKGPADPAITLMPSPLGAKVPCGGEDQINGSDWNRSWGPMHISGVLSDIHQDTVNASFKLD